MVGMYIGGTAAYCGKHTFAIALARKLQQEGYRVGYMKPVATLPLEKNGEVGDEDAFFMREMLELSAPMDKLTPVIVDQDFRMRSFRTVGSSEYMERIKEAYQELSADKDVMIVMGTAGMFTGKYCGLDGVSIVQALDLQVILLDRYIHNLAYDSVFVLHDMLQKRLLGVVLNAIPPAFQSELDTLLIPKLQQKDIRVLGTIPQDLLLGAIGVDQLGKSLGGRLVCGLAQSSRMVEDFLIGTMQVENFATHFQKKRNTAILVGGDRSDVQFVALEGECSCLILTGNIYPSDVVITRAEALGVPIFVVRSDTYSVARQVEDILKRHKLRSIEKVGYVERFINGAVDFNRIKSQLQL